MIAVGIIIYGMVSYLDLSVEAELSRAQDRNEADRFETKTVILKENNKRD